MNRLSQVDNFTDEFHYNVSACLSKKTFCNQCSNTKINTEYRQLAKDALKNSMCRYERITRSNPVVLIQFLQTS